MRIATLIVVVLIASCFLGCQEQTPAVVVQADPPVDGDAGEEYMSLHAALGQPLHDRIAMADGQADARLSDNLDANKGLIDRLAYATRMTECDWGVPEEPDFDTMLPHLGKVRALARVLNVDARRLARAGQGDAASRRVAGMVRLAGHTAEEGSRTVIEWLVANAVLDLAADAAVYCSADFDAPQRGRVLAEFQAIDLDDTFGLEAMIALDIERTTGTEYPPADAAKLRETMQTTLAEVRRAIAVLEGDA